MYIQNTTCPDCKKIAEYNHMIVISRSQRMLRRSKCSKCRKEEKAHGK